MFYPKVAYPTYLVGALIAGAQAIAVDASAQDWGGADLAWINSPSNPTGEVLTDEQVLQVINWSRKNNSVVASDECYLSFAPNAKSILELADGDNTGLLAVHSLSKSSNMAGYRAAFIVGDPKLIDQIRQIRKHAGLMLSSPVQAAMIIALSDNKHVVEQAGRYSNRREILSSALNTAGFTIKHSKAGLYIWCTKGENCFKTVDWFASLGILVTPGSFYGDDNFVRVALTATDENIMKASERIKS